MKSSASRVEAKVRCKTALVAHRRRQPLFVRPFFQRVENLRSPAHRLGKRIGTYRHHHEFLKIDGVVGMLAAIDDVHHRHRQDMRIDPADIAIQRQPARIGSGFRNGQAYAQYRVGSKVRLVVSAIQVDHHRINIFLILGIEVDQRFTDIVIHRGYRLQHPLAHVARLVAVTLLGGFISAGRRARRHGCAAETAIFQQHIDFDRRVAPAVEDFAGVNVDYGCHGVAPSGRRGTMSAPLSFWSRFGNDVHTYTFTR